MLSQFMVIITTNCLAKIITYDVFQEIKQSLSVWSSIGPTSIEFFSEQLLALWDLQKTSTFQAQY